MRSVQGAASWAVAVLDIRILVWISSSSNKEPLRVFFVLFLSEKDTYFF